MTTIIRVSPFQPSSGEPPFFGSDKWNMVKSCHESFLQAGDSERIYVLDRCPDEWADYFSKYGTVVREDFSGSQYVKLASLHKAYQLVDGLSGNFLFLEDDYLWKPNTLDTLDKAVSHFGVVSPYDHPDGYQTRVQEVYVFNDNRYRWCPTNTHTFAVTSEIFNKNRESFMYGLHDWIMWSKLQTIGVRLYTPIDSMATHLVKGKLAYGTNWN